MKTPSILIALFLLPCTLIGQQCRILSFAPSGEITYWVSETNLYIGFQICEDLGRSNEWCNTDIYDGLWNIRATNQAMSITTPSPTNSNNPQLFIRVVCSRDPLPEAVLGIGYQVYGGDSFTTDEPRWWKKGYNPATYGYSLLGSATNTSTFSGKHNVYIIRTARYNVANLDAVFLGNVGYYEGGVSSGDTPNWENVTGPPDGQFAPVGGDGSPEGGFIVIHPHNPNATSITVHIVL